MVPLHWNTSQLFHHPSADCGRINVYSPQGKAVEEIIQIGRAGDEIAAVPLGLKLLNHLIVLIPNFAHQFLQNILHRHDSHGAAVFIHNHCHVGFP